MIRKQQLIWQKEHQTADALPEEMAVQSSIRPSQYIVQFQKFLAKQKISQGKIVDIGAGKGRNSIFLAKQGYEVYSLDYIQAAIDHINTIAKQENIEKYLHTFCTAIDQNWPFPDDFFEIAVDCFASIDIETRKGRDTYKKELLRTLKPGGYALVTVVSADDEIEREMIKLHPGSEKNSTIWPQNDKFQKNYDEQELRKFYKEFEIITLKKVTKKANKLGRNFIATNFYLVLRKSI